MSLLDRSFQLVENHVVICGLPSLGQYLLYESPIEKVDKWTMLKIRLSCRAVFIVVVLLSVGIAAVKADDITLSAERSSRLRGEGTRLYGEYGGSVHTDSGGQDTALVNDDENDNDDDEEDIDDGEHEQFDENEDDELEDDGLGPSFKHYYSSIQHSRGMNADDDTKADEIRKENEGGSKKQSLLMKDEEMGDDEQYDGNEEEEIEHDELEPSARNSKSPMHHTRTWKKDEILEGNVNRQQKQPTNAGDDNGETEDDSGDDADGSASGEDSGSAVQQTSHTRKQDLDAEEAKHKNNSSHDEENEPGNVPFFRSPLIFEPNNETILRKTAFEEATKAEQLKNTKEDSDSNDDVSGDESGSTSDFVQGSGELTEDITREQPLTKPRAQNRTNLSKDRKEQRVAVYQDSKIQLKNLKAKYTEKTGKHHQNVHTSSSVNETKFTMKGHEIESNHHTIALPAENKAEKKELHGEKVDRTFRVSKEKLNVTNNTVSKLESPIKKRPVEGSKVSLRSSRKGLHSQHMARVTQAVQNHSKHSHTMPIRKAPSAEPQSCQSEKILSGHSLKGGTRAGQFEILGEASSMRACLQRCCSKQDCDVALLIDGRCYGVGCYSKELCLAVPVPHPHFVFSQLAYVDKGHKRGDIEFHREFLCKYGTLTLRNNEQWSGELCGGVVRCKNGVATVKKCSGIPPKPDHCAKPQLIVKHQPGTCCKMKWRCKASHCVFNNRLIKHGSKLSDPLCTGIVRCLNGHLKMEYCPQIPEKPKDCARPVLKTINVPGKCCKKHWVCSDKTCKYDSIKLQHREKLTDASCAVVMECRNGFLRSKRCPGPPPVPNACINPSLHVKRLPGECCEMNWTCAIS